MKKLIKFMEELVDCYLIGYAIGEILAEIENEEGR
jgi:hypothetical protein